VADEPFVNRGGGDDDVARLVALTERQHELWDLLRDTKDERVRNDLLDELTANREELARLKGKVTSEVDRAKTAPRTAVPGADVVERPRSVGEELRSRILTPDPGRNVAPAQPPPPPPPPAMRSRPLVIGEPAGDGEPSHDAPSVDSLREPQAAPVASAEAAAAATTDSDDIDVLLPEKTPYRTREDDLADTRARRQAVAPKQPDPESAPEPEPEPEPEPAETVAPGRHRPTAHETFMDLDRMRPHVSSRRYRLFPIVAILIALAAVAAAVWYLFFFDRAESDQTGTTTTTVTTAAAEVAAPAVDQIQAVVDGMNLGTVAVEERDGTIYLAGAVGSDADRNAIIGAVKALAGAMPVDVSGLSVPVRDDELRVAVLDAISAAGFDKINVSVSGGVATLTGVTPADGPAALIDAVKSVDGISQVVDMTETADRAEALATELDRITAVTPIVFESGQVALNALQERILDSAAEIILAYDGPIVTIVGYTDAAGTAAENERISLQRAERVQDYLVAQGVPAERLAVDARGESGATGAESVAGLERRVEFEVGYAVAAGGNAGLRIGIVAPSARDDMAFTQSIVDAADVIANEREDVTIDISDGLFVTADAEAAIREYAAEGYDLVIAHGSQYGPSLAAIAPDYPDVAFAWGTAADTFDLPNVSAYAVAADEGGYVMGTVAARLTESNVIGIVGPLEVGDAAQYIDGFRAGVTATNPTVSVLTTYTGSFSDLGLAAEAATNEIDSGADVLTGSAQMVVGAVGVAAENGALWFGNQSNQTALAPNLVVASQVYHWEVALRQIIAGLDQGVLGDETYTLTLANGGIIIEFNPGYSLPADIAAAADETTAGIIDGSIVTGQ
jgi:basic membrane protein A